MKLLPPLRVALGLLVVLLLAALAVFWWSTGQNKRSSLKVLTELEKVVNGSNRSIPQNLVVLPETARTKSPAEAEQWLRDVLREEISKEGIQELKQSARFGPLNDVFPESAGQWAQAAGAAPDECYAFRLDRNGVTAEVVLVPGPNGFRISRCNNVKQMAPTTPRT